MITPVTPSVTAWPTASAITFGQALSASTLSGGSATVAGSFAFTAPSTVPGAVGTYSAAVTFTPTDTTNYTSVSGNVNVTVNAASYTLTYAAGTGGTLSGTSPQTVAHGGSGTAVTAVANTGYTFASWSDGNTNATRTDSNVTANLTRDGELHAERCL